MQQLDLSLKILNEILDDGVLFADSLAKLFKANADLRPHRAVVAKLVGCELRHHLQMEFLLKDLPLEEEEKRFAALVLANNYYSRGLDSAECVAALKEKLGEEKLAAVQPLLDKCESREQIIPDSVELGSNEYLSLRYNTPIWVIKIWQHFGGSNTYKTLRANQKPAPSYLRVRTSRISAEEILANPDFKAAEVADMVRYDGSTPLRKIDAYRENKLFLERPIMKKLLDAYQVHEPSEILAYNGNADPALEKELIETYGSSIGINLATPNVDEKVDVTKMIRGAGLHNVNFFSAADPLSMDVAVSRKVGLVIVAPDSTNFDLIRSTPDYLLHFKKDGMDELFQKQKDALEGCAKYVEEDGTLIYMISTISRKEGHNTVSEFLRNHSDFVLKEEKQSFPFEEEGCAFYYAVLKQTPNLAKAEPPMSDLSAIAEPQRPALSADSE